MIGLAHVRAGLSGAAAIPAFLISFQNGVLDPRVSFTRASQATLFDATGRLTYAPNNLAIRSEEINLWGKINSTVTANTFASPLGGLTADTITQTASASDQVYSLGVSWPIGAFGIVSIWARSASGTKKFRLKFNDTYSNQFSTDFTATTTWQRFWFKSTSGAQAAGHMAVAGCVAGEAGDLIVWGAQAEAVTYQTTPGAYVATTAAVYYGARFDYDPATLAPCGLLIEAATTNKVSGSEGLTGWVLETGIVRAATTGLDGTASATLMSELIDGWLAKGFRSPATMTLAGVVETSSIYAKYAGRKWLRAARNDSSGAIKYVWFDIQNGVLGTVQTGLTASILNAGGGFYRCVVTCVTPPGWGGMGLSYGLTNADGDTGSNYSGTPGAGIIVQAPQFEVGAAASSYIPTGASAVARAADIAKLTPPAGVSALRFTFDDASTQDVSVASGVEYTIPATLNRSRIKSIR